MPYFLGDDIIMKLLFLKDIALLCNLDGILPVLPIIIIFIIVSAVLDPDVFMALVTLVISVRIRGILKM
jgi:hypothetical protein